MVFRPYRLFAAAALMACLAGVVWQSQIAAFAQSTQTESIAEKIAAEKALLDINTATAGQLSALPGMGAAYAQRVIAGRPYSAKNQLVQRGILPEDVYLKIKESIIAHRVKK
jgi:competence protein ComEA